jgi:hypothetical protein
VVVNYKIKRRVTERLFDHLYKLGIDNSTIRSHQPETVDACSRCNGALGGIPQGPQRRQLQSYLVSQWKHTKYRVGIQFLKEFVESHLEKRLCSAGENGDLEQTYRTQSHRLAAADCRFQRSQLCTGKLPVIGQPSNEYVCIQQQTGKQAGAPYADPAISQTADVSALTMSPVIRALPAQLFRGDFQAVRFTGPRTATGRPRLVIVMGSPDFSISPRQARHLALNSVALSTRSVIHFHRSSSHGHLTK